MFRYKIFNNFNFNQFYKYSILNHRLISTFNFVFSKQYTLNPDITNSLSKLGINELNALQNKVIPNIQSKKDIVITAETGSGKTLTYLIPILEDILSSNTIHLTKIPHCIILVPNKELAWQVGSVVQSMLYTLEQSQVEILFDKTKLGLNNKEQTKIILISTPSALVDTNQSTFLKLTKILNQTNTVVIDEVDLLLSGSFGGKTQSLLAQLNKLNEATQKHIQFIFVGASLDPSKSKKAIKTYLQKKFPKALYLDSENKHRTVDTLTEEFIKVPNGFDVTEENNWKLNNIIERIKLESNSSLPKSNEQLPKICLVFFNSIEKVKEWYLTINEQLDVESSIQCIQLHKELTKKEREDKLKLLKFGPDNKDSTKPKLIVVFTTDIMARGIDLENLDLVIQAEFPSNISTYLHRAGRTARAGRLGTVISYVSKQDSMLADEIEFNHNLKLENNSEKKGTNDANFDKLFSRRRSLNRKIKAKTSPSYLPNYKDDK